ncbi:MAG: hypothetical protein K5871_04910 [Lachnospiraceae bacterium]|nr:hypothetical protein [Lachnospiraceae bacterium]
MREVEISLKSLFFYVLSHWKSIIVGMIIGAILVGAIGSFRTGATTSTADDASTPESEIATDGMSSSIAYLVKTNSPDELISVQQPLLAMLRSSNYFGYISSVTQIPVADLKKLVTIDGSGINDAAIMAAIVVNITDVPEENVEQILEATKIFIEDRSEELIEKGFPHELIRTDSFEYEKESHNAIEAEESQTLPSDAAEPSVVNRGFSKKYAIIGFLLGFFVVAFWHFVIYIFANRLEEDDDIERLFGIYLFGLIPGKSFGKPLYKLRNIGKRTFNTEESCKLVSTKIKMTAEKNNITKLGIIGCGIEKNSKDISELLVKNLKGEGLDAVLIDNPLYDESSVKKLSGFEHVIFFEKVGETYRTEIWKETDLAKNLGIAVDGIIMAGR